MLRATQPSPIIAVRILPQDARTSDQSIIEGLSRTHGAALIRYFLRRGVQGSDAEDAAQEVFVRLARRGGIAGIDRADGYLFQTAASVAADLFRRGRSRFASAHVTYDEMLHARADHSPEEILEGREELRLVMIGLKELPERTRSIFILARLEHMKQNEIASRLGLSIAAVEKNIQKAVAHLAMRVGRTK